MLQTYLTITPTSPETASQEYAVIDLYPGGIEGIAVWVAEMAAVAFKVAADGRTDQAHLAVGFESTPHE